MTPEPDTTPVASNSPAARDETHARNMADSATYANAYREAETAMRHALPGSPDYAPDVTSAHYRAAIRAELALRAELREADKRQAAKRDREAAKALEADRAMTEGRLEHAHGLLDAARRNPLDRALAVRAATAASAVGLVERQHCRACDNPDADPFYAPSVDPLDFFYLCAACKADKSGRMSGKARASAAERERQRAGRGAR